MWRVVRIGVGQLRHNGEIEDVVMKNDAVLELCVKIRGRARYAQAHFPKRSHQGGQKSYKQYQKGMISGKVDVLNFHFL